MIIPNSPVIFEGFKGVVENTLDLELTPKESPAAINIETDKIDGILTKKNGFKQVGSLGSTLLLENCEQTTGWIFISGVSGSADTAIPVIGTKSLKMTIAHGTLSTGVAAYKTLSPASDWSSYAGVGFYVRSSVALAAGSYQFMVSESAALATPAETINIPALTAGVWQYVYLPFAAAGATRDAVLTFGINIAVDKGDLDFYLDNIDLVRTDDFPVDLCETQWTAKTYVTSTADGTVFKQGTYSAKHVVATGFATGIISTHVIPPMDLSKFNYVGFWLRSTVALPSGTLSIMLDDTAACASPIESLIIKKELLANTWTYCVVQLAAASSDTAIISVGLYANSTLATLLPTIYIDDIRAASPIVAEEEYNRTDGSRILMVSNGESVYKSTDAGATFTIVASGLNKEYYIWFETFNGECFWGNGSNYNSKYDINNNTVIYSAATPNAYYMPKARAAWVHQDTIMGLLYATDPITVRYNDPAKTSIEAGWFPAARSKDLQDSTGDYLVCAGAFSEKSVIFLTNSFVILSGSDHADFDWLPKNFGIGCTIRDSIQIKDGYLIFANDKGVYRMDESFVPVKMSEPIKETYSTLVQPSLAYNFWLQSTKSEFESGTYGNIITTRNPGKVYQNPQGKSHDLIKTNADAQTDWTAGTNVNTDLTTSVGDVIVSGNNPQVNLALNILPFYIDTAGTVSSFGAELTDSNDSNYTEWGGSGSSSGHSFGTVKIDLGAAYAVRQVIVAIALNQGVVFQVFISTDESTYTQYGSDFTATTTITAPISARYIRVSFYGSARMLTTRINYVKVYPSTYNPQGSIITQPLNYSFVPSTLGDMTAEVTIPSGCSIVFSGRSSATSTFAGAYVTLGTATSTAPYTYSLSGLTALQYVEIKAVLNTNPVGDQTPVLSAIYIGAQYLSAKHNIGTVPTKWGQFLTNDVPNNQTVSYEIRSATTTGAVDTAIFYPILPGTPIAEPLANTWAQIRVTLNSNRYDQIPTVDWFQLNWVTASTTTLPTTLLASILYDRKYYLFGQIQGDDYNNTCFVLDKNWNWNILTGYPVGASVLFNETPYMGSAFSGGVMQLFYGNVFDYGDRQDAIECYWDTSRIGRETKNRNKCLEGLVVFFEPVNSGTLTVYYDIGNTGTWSTFGTVDLTEGDGEVRLLPSGFINGRDIRLRFYNNGSNETLIIYKIELYYSIYEDLGYF